MILRIYLKIVPLDSFGGLFPLELGTYQNPVLVSGTDGVGTKLLIAIKANLHKTIGIDLVAMCVNDVLAQGAKPLFFLDYLGVGHLDNDKAKDIVSGVVEGVSQAQAKLVGGETAEMPDMYTDGHYDLAGFAVGIADKAKLLSAKNLREGDVLLGLASNGLHSNGFSLVRDILFKQHDYSLDETLPGCELDLKHELLRPTKIYVKSVLPLIDKGKLLLLPTSRVVAFPKTLPEFCLTIFLPSSIMAVGKCRQLWKIFSALVSCHLTISSILSTLAWEWSLPFTQTWLKTLKQNWRNPVRPFIELVSLFLGIKKLLFERINNET